MSTDTVTKSDSARKQIPSKALETDDQVTERSSLKALAMPSLDEQIQSILEAHSSDDDSSHSSPITRPRSDDLVESPSVLPHVRALSRKRATRRLEFTVTGDNIEVEPDTDASWIVEPQSCTQSRSLIYFFVLHSLELPGSLLYCL